MTMPLAGAGVIITRPTGQCEALASSVEAAGGHALILPAMSIEPTSAASDWPSGCPNINEYQLLVFISRNAVKYGAHYLSGRDTEIAAVGPSTAKSLQAAGHPASVVSSQGFTSEALLDHPRLQDMRGKRVLIVRGVGGRDLLKQSMTARGARVDYLEVYCRTEADIPAGVLDQVRKELDSGHIRFVTATSVQTLENTLQLLGAEARHLLGRSQLVSASDRVVQKAKELGIPTAEPASGPSDQDLLEHMIRLTTNQASEHS